MVAVEKYQKNSDIINTIEIPEVIVRMRQDGIVHVTFRKGVVLDLGLQAKLLNINIEITGGKKTILFMMPKKMLLLQKKQGITPRRLNIWPQLKAQLLLQII